MGSPRAADVHDELADVAVYLLRLADVLYAYLLEVVRRKLGGNRERFPPGQVSGRADVPPAQPQSGGSRESSGHAPRCLEDILGEARP